MSISHTQKNLKHLRRLAKISLRAAAAELGMSVKEYKFLENDFSGAVFPVPVRGQLKQMLIAHGLSESVVSIMDPNGVSAELDDLVAEFNKADWRPQDFPTDDVAFRQHVQAYLSYINDGVFKILRSINGLPL